MELTPPIVALGEQAAEAATAFEQAFETVATQKPSPQPPGVSDGYMVAEDTYEPCNCLQTARGAGGKPYPNRPDHECLQCHGTGYRLTKRIVRPVPQQSLGEQAAYAQIKALHAHIRTCAKTFKVTANHLLEPDHAKRARYAHEALAVLEAILAPVEGQD